MLGFLKNIKVAEITHWKGDEYYEGDWHLAIHHNDNRDTIEYHFFMSKDSAIRFAKVTGVREDDIYVSYGKENVNRNDVHFTCSHCGRKFVMGGGVLDIESKSFPICRECVLEIIEKKKEGVGDVCL